jgi:hypothetical protein
LTIRCIEVVGFERTFTCLSRAFLLLVEDYFAWYLALDLPSGLVKLLALRLATS